MSDVASGSVGSSVERPTSSTAASATARQRIAYLILAHHQPRHLSSLVDRLASEESHFFIHLDSRVGERDFTFSPRHLERVTMLPRDERRSIRWCGFSMVDATLALIRHADARPVRTLRTVVRQRLSDQAARTSGSHSSPRSRIHTGRLRGVRAGRIPFRSLRESRVPGGSTFDESALGPLALAAYRPQGGALGPAALSAVDANLLRAFLVEPDRDGHTTDHGSRRPTTRARRLVPTDEVTGRDVLPDPARDDRPLAFRRLSIHRPSRRTTATSSSLASRRLGNTQSNSAEGARRR